VKLVLCIRCSDVVKLSETARQCQCGECGGIVTDDLSAEVYGGDKAVVLGILNSSLVDAISAQMREGDLTERVGGIYGDEVKGREFVAFVIPDSAPTVRRMAGPAFSRTDP
jgi:hypothetical protein